jgi:sulfite reductase alpha subunit-like flavoprotein
VRPVQGELVPAYTVERSSGAAPRDLTEVASKWALQNGLFLGKVLENRELKAPASDRSTHHIEIQLPDKMGYTAGDHLAVLVSRVCLAVAGMVYMVWMVNGLWGG